MEPKRILCVFSLLNRGGAENMCMNIYRHIDRSKIQFDFVKHVDIKGDFEDEIVALGGRIYHAPRFKMYNYFSYARWWRRHFQNHPEHQIVHAHFFTISPIYLRIAKRYGRTTINHIHGMTAGGGIKDFIAKRSAKVSDYKFACSELAGYWGYQSEKFEVVNNALEIREYRFDESVRLAAREELGLSQFFVMGTVANFSAVKNPFGLIRIFEVASKLNPEARLLWVGSGPMQNKIEEEIKKRNLAEKILLMGNRDDVPRLLQAMDVFVLPSFSEGLPVSLIEAQTAGLPCLCSDVITREVNITGLCKFISVDDIEKWSEECKHISATCRDTAYMEVARNGYDISETSRRLQYFYENLEK